jgi:hypothetical protein
MDTHLSLPQELWEQTPPAVQAYIGTLEARVVALEAIVHSLEEQVRTFQQELEEFFTPSIERSASVATSKSPTRSAPSWGATGSSGPYSPPHPGGICR